MILQIKNYQKLLINIKVGIFNLAAETHVDRSIDGPENFIQSNIFGVFTILDENFQKRKGETITYFN